MLRHAWLLVFLLAGCGGATLKQRADGTYSFDCSEQKRCLERASETCGEQGYILVGGKSNKKKYGTPGNELYVGKDEIHVRCNRDRPVDAPDSDQGDWSLRRKKDGAPAASAKPNGEPSAAKEALTKTTSPVCRPGETQRCVGPGACDGGQACLADGSGFGLCDCGSKSPDANAAPLPARAAEGAVVPSR